MAEVAAAALREVGYEVGIVALGNGMTGVHLLNGGHPPAEMVYRATQIARGAGGKPTQTYDEWLDDVRDEATRPGEFRYRARYWLKAWGLDEDDEAPR